MEQQKLFKAANKCVSLFNKYTIIRAHPTRANRGMDDHSLEREAASGACQIMLVKFNNL